MLHIQSRNEHYIDYALVRYDALNMIHKFEIGARSLDSDHLPIHARMQVPITMKENEE
eukprot:c36984_g1_i1 orf=43-216(+)